MPPTQITAYSAKDFRTWLKKNHKKEHKVVVILHKKHTGKTAPRHSELMDEAICFGWIDTTIKRLDEDRFMINFSKRTDKSKWSDNTLSYGKRLIKEGKMSEQGLYFYKMGKAKPTHDHGIPKNPEIPQELELALSKNSAVKKKFDLYPPSSKRTFYRWILRGKLLETRKKRIEKIISMVGKDRREIL